MLMVNKATEVSAGDLRCRPIRAADLPAVADLLTRGFPARRRGYWVRALNRLGARPTPSDLPPYGYLLEAAGKTVGVILTIFSGFGDQQVPPLCNLSSWYVEPAYRTYAGPLISAATRRKDVTYVNISPAPHTRPIIEAQGFRPYAAGQFLLLPAWTAGPEDARIRAFGVAGPGRSLDPAEEDLLADHAALGCLCLLGPGEQGRAEPFIFVPRRIRRVVPAAQLIWSRDLDSFARLAAPLGRFLLRRGFLAVTLDAPAPLPGLPGRFFPGKAPRYAKGPNPPRVGDLSYTELALFGA